MGFDITLHDKITDKKEREKNWCMELTNNLGVNGYIFFDLWTTYDNKTVREAKLTGQYDKLDCIVHAKEKQRKGYYVGDFFENAERHMVDPFPQLVHFRLTTDRGDLEPYKLYEGFLNSFDKFESSHERYAKSHVYNAMSFTEYLKTYENPALTQKSLSSMVGRRSIAKAIAAPKVFPI